MPPRNLWISLGVIALGVVAIVLSALASARTGELSLPLPSSLPGINIAIPIATGIAWVLTRRLPEQIKNYFLGLLLRYSAQASTLTPFILLILSLVYAIPSDIQSCAADQQWLKMWENHDARGIRAIQSRLQCCGYNSMHDRAWPFPSRDSDVRTCERTMGYTIACGREWQGEEQYAARLTAIASFLNWIMMVLVVNAFPPEEQGRVRLPAWSAESNRLIEGNAVEEEDDDSHTQPPQIQREEGDNQWHRDVEREI